MKRNPRPSYGFLRPSARARWLMARCASSAPGPGYAFWRGVLMCLHGCDVGRGARLPNDLFLPHPVGIVIGEGVIVGRGSTIYQNVTLGRTRHGYPVLGDEVIVYPGATVVGAIKIGRRARVGPNQLVTTDLAEGEVFAAKID